MSRNQDPIDDYISCLCRYTLCAVQIQMTASIVRTALPSLRPHELTAILLQFAGTNVAAADLNSFYCVAQQRAHALLPKCSLQQVADITWALHRAQAAVATTFYRHVAEFAATWLKQRFLEGDASLASVPAQPRTPTFILSSVGKQTPDRDTAKEAANFLYRVRHNTDVRQFLGGGIITGMLRIVSEGAVHVRP